MERLLARFGSRKRHKDKPSSTDPTGSSTTKRPSHTSTPSRQASTSTNSGKPPTVSKQSFKSEVNGPETSASGTLPPRIELDFKTPAERAISDQPYQQVNHNHQRDEGTVRNLSDEEQKKLHARKFTSEEATLAWTVSGTDLIASGCHQPRLFSVNESVVEQEWQDFYRLCAIFSITTDPALLPQFPAVSDYYPPPTFISDNHDWVEEYKSYSGYIRDPQVLVKLLRWTSKRVNVPALGQVDSTHLPEWYRLFAERERQSGYPLDSFTKILRYLVPATYFRYLETIFEKMLVICPLEGENGASVDWVSGLLGWWVLGMQMTSPDALDVVDVMQQRWQASSRALGHLFRCWVRSLPSEPGDSALPIYIRRLVAQYEGAQFEPTHQPTEEVLWLDVVNEVEHDNPAGKLSHDELGIGLIRESRYGTPLSIEPWLASDASQDGPATPGSPSTAASPLFQILSRTTTVAGEPLTAYDPIVVPLPNSPSSVLETGSVYRPFRKASTSSYFSEAGTPLTHRRQLSSGTISLANASDPRPIANLTAISTLPSETPDWNSFAQQGFKDVGDSVPLKLGDAFVEKNGTTAAKIALSNSASLPVSASNSLGRHQRKRDPAGVYSISHLSVHTINACYLDFLKDAVLDSNEDVRTGWPTFVILKTNEDELTGRKLQAEWLVIAARRSRLKPPPKPTPSPAQSVPVSSQNSSAPSLARKSSASLLTSRSKTPTNELEMGKKSLKGKKRTSLFNMLSLGPNASSTNDSPSEHRQRLPTSQSFAGTSRSSKLSSLKGNQSVRDINSLLKSRDGMSQSRPAYQKEPAPPLPTQNPTGYNVAKVNGDMPPPQLGAARVAITGSDSKGNIVDIQQDGELQDASLAMEDGLTDTEAAHTPTSAFTPDLAAATPDRGRRSAAPSPDSSQFLRETTAVPTVNQAEMASTQIPELDEHVAQLKLNDTVKDSPTHTS